MTPKEALDELTKTAQEDGFYDRGAHMKISIKKFRANEGYESDEAWADFVNELVLDSVCPALCSKFCEVEPDGTCEHGCPSVLLELGLI